jgi:predicted AAA+ superfamily ATPase
MKRTLEAELVRWKNNTLRLPLILRGARQVGKSYLIESFGKAHFQSLHVLNFEFEPQLKTCFESNDPSRIIASLEVVLNTSIIPGQSLLFLDEIQECPKALIALRYFKEKLPELHIIGAGSLLEFTLREEAFSFPVGRVQFLYLKPFSFYEFIIGIKEDKLAQSLVESSILPPPPQAIHDYAMSLFRKYLFIGGMPAAIQTFTERQSFLDTKRVHQVLLQSYQADFGKYATKAQHKYLQRFFEKAPAIVGQHFKYVEVDSEARARDLKVALQQLTWSGLIHPIYETHASGIPLQSQIDEKKFKLLFLDIGLLQTAGKIDPQTIFEEEIIQIRSGALAEQLVGQELLAYSDSYEPPQLYFWKRENKNSKAEVDYVVQIGTHIIPLEVKSGKTGHLKSLHRFMEDKKSPLGVKVSGAELSLEKNILSVPFYLIHQLPRLIQEAIGLCTLR